MYALKCCCRLSNKEKEMEELYSSLEQKTATIMSLESEKEVLNAELSSTRELSKIHQHLQVFRLYYFILMFAMFLGHNSIL